MKNISGQYQDLLEGKMTQAQFLRNARMMFPNFVTNHNSFDDSVKILKTKGMLVEGNAVKGAPDKEPTYDYPTQPGKYKKVEQSPEVDEQDGIYPATTLTDIPKEEVSKPIKSKNRPDGLEDIKDNDTKNELKKVKVVKENVDIEIKKLIDTKKIDPAKVKAAAEKAMRGDSTELAFLMAFGDKAKPVSEDLDTYNVPPQDRPKYKTWDNHDDDDQEPFNPYTYLKQEYSSKAKAIENNIFDAADEEDKDYWEEFMALESPKEVDVFIERFTDKELEENQRSFDDIFGDFIETDDATEIKSYLKTKGKEAIAKIKTKLPQLKDAARTKLAKLMKVELDEARSKKIPNKELSIKERLKPAITKLVQEVLDEMGPK